MGCWVAPRREISPRTGSFFLLGFRRASGSEDTGGFWGVEGVEDHLYTVNRTLPKINTWKSMVGKGIFSFWQEAYTLRKEFVSMKQAILWKPDRCYFRFGGFRRINLDPLQSETPILVFHGVASNLLIWAHVKRFWWNFVLGKKYWNGKGISFHSQSGCWFLGIHPQFQEFLVWWRWNSRTEPVVEGDNPRRFYGKLHQVQQIAETFSMLLAEGRLFMVRGLV